VTFFMQKIDHNSVNLNRIPTKIGTKMHFLKSSLFVPSFKLIAVHIHKL